MSCLPAQAPLRQLNHPAPRCRVMKNNIISQYLCKYFFFLLVYTLRIIFASQVSLNMVAEFRTQQISCVARKTADKIVLQHSILSSLPMKYDTEIKVLELMKPPTEITHFTKWCLSLSLTKSPERKPQEWDHSEWKWFCGKIKNLFKDLCVYVYVYTYINYF